MTHNGTAGAARAAARRKNVYDRGIGRGGAYRHGGEGALGRLRGSTALTVFMYFFVPMVTTVTLEWIARGTLGANRQGNGFWEAVGPHFVSFFISYLLLVALYVLVCNLSGLHWIAVLSVGLAGNLPGVVTYFKMTMRGEPFLPWDLSQIGDLMAVKSSVKFTVPSTVFFTLAIFLLLTVAAAFVRLPRGAKGNGAWFARLVSAGTALAVGLTLVFGVFLSARATAALGIYEDMWMQDRYYRTNGVLTGFLTNLRMLRISRPQGYDAQAVEDILRETRAGGAEPYYASSFAAGGGALGEAPDIIFLMAESFWDVTQLNGVTYSEPVLPNLTALAREGAYGTAYSPSYGGGTCDVEFEALTGLSMEFLPSGAKPFQQYVTEDLFSLPQTLKQRGYSTVAIHGYGRRFWNRDMAYPNLGIDTFVAEDDFVNPERRRGFISDDEMVRRMIEELEARQAQGPVFMHAVTMQNHTTYDRGRYPAGRLVNVVNSPAALPGSTIGQLEDCATGIRDMDAALGKLTSYLRERERPTILVFWGDHKNPMSDGTAIFEAAGLIEEGETSAPYLHETPILYWSNFDTSHVDLGTISTYYITPVLMDLYGLEKSVFMQFLAQQLRVSHGRTRGVTVQPDGTYEDELSGEQQAWFDRHAILQYALLFEQDDWVAA